jgi:hypothetical protein
MKKHFISARAGALFAMLLWAGSAAWAQDTGSGSVSTGTTGTDLDSLFGGDVVESPAPATAAPVDPISALLSGDKFKIGGSFSGALNASATWSDYWGGTTPFLEPDSTALAATLKSTLYFDARPDDNFRVYGSVKSAWPFSTLSATASIFELFADFNLNDKAFFRFGKSTVKWGVGYFWSPADVINPEPINLMDATAQREGPVNFRVNIPMFGTQNNFYMYTIIDEKNVTFSTTALAAKAEFLVGPWELGIGGYYRYDTAERGMLTLTGPIGNFDVFGEAMLSRGSAKTFVTNIATTPPYTISYSKTANNRENLYFSASTGFMFSNQKDNFSVVGQYYYNGEGYTNADRKALIADAETAIAAVAGNPAASAILKAALPALAAGSGQHYAALSISKSKLFADDLSASIIAVGNLSDLSAILKPTFSWAVNDYFKLSLSPLFVVGASDSEYPILFGGNPCSVTVGATVSGAF